MNDQKLEIIIGNLLRAGVLLAAVIVFAGGALYLARDHAHHVDYKNFVAGTSSTRTLPGIVDSAVHLNSMGLMQLGLVLLIATPVARVALAVIGFALERDRMYTVVSLIVLGVLIYSLFSAT
ncbi:MAG: DUF1634 domain-containing protein [Acidobacteriota bacterium]|nr:DUF1634 domain-containing protein [Acidobacteriota bacterium]